MDLWWRRRRLMVPTGCALVTALGAHLAEPHYSHADEVYSVMLGIVGTVLVFLLSQDLDARRARQTTAGGDEAGDEPILFFKALGLSLFMLSPEERETWFVVQGDLDADIREMREMRYGRIAILFVIGWRSITEMAGLHWYRVARLFPVVSLIRRLFGRA